MQAAPNARYVYDREFGWIAIPDPFIQSSDENKSEGFLPEKIETEKKASSVPVFVVGSKNEIDLNHMPDTSGKTQIFVQKETNGEVLYLHCRQLNLKTAITNFQTYKLVTEVDDPSVGIAMPLELKSNETSVPSNQQAESSGLPDGIMSLLLDTITNLNNKLDNIDGGIKGLADSILKNTAKGGKPKDDKFANHSEATT